MAANARNIRKVEHSKVADFDDQLWPINCAILILAGCVVGVIVGMSDFQHSHPFYNGWTHLIGVAVMVGLLFWGVMWLQGKIRRRLLLCILISLLAHLWLLIDLHHRYLSLLAQREAEAQARVVEQYQEITVPDYNWEQIEEPELHEDYDKPIETEAPKPTEPESIQREADAPEVPAELERADEPEVPQRQQPNPAVARRADLSAPRRADAAAGAQISRQEWKHQPRPNEPIPEPELTAQSQQAAAVPNPNLAPRRRESSQVSVDQRQTFEEASSSRDEPIPVNLARRASQQQPLPDRPTTPSPSRQISRAADVPRTMAAAPEPVRVAQATPRTDQPQSTTPMTARRQDDAPAMVRQTAQPTATPTAPSMATLAAAQHRTSQTAPQPAETARTAPVRRPSPLNSPTTTSRPQTEAVAAVSTPSQAAPSVPSPQRAAATSSPSRVDVAQQASTSATTDSTAVARNTARRAVNTTETSAQPRATRPTRTATPRAVPQVTTAQIEQATTPSATVPSTTPSVAAARPSTTSVSRSAAGAAQVVQEQSTSRALPTMTSAVQLPAAMAARRSAATRQDPADSARAPSRPTTLARSSGGVSLPSTAIATEAQPAAMPASTGGAPSSRVAEVASSAAVRRDAANPTAGSSAGAAGSAEYAVGSAQLVARSGQPRSTGAGRPSATANGPTPRLARSSGPAPSVAASGTPGEVAAAPSPATSTTQRPSLPAMNAQASAARQGGTVRPLASQAAVGSGPSGSSGTSGAIGAASISRVTRHESVASAMAGGGTPRPGPTIGAAAAPNAMAETSTPTATQPSGGSDQPAMHTLAPTSGPRRQIAGLPGGLQSQPRSGAIASLTSQGAPLAASVARRSPGSSEQADGSEVGATRTVTMHRTTRGTDLPTAAVAAEQTPQPGAAGIAMAQGGLPSSLEVGKTATVRRAAGDVAAGSQTAAASAAESATGSARAVAMAGRMRSSGDELPQLSAGSVAVRSVIRPSSTGPAAAPTGTVDAQPTTEALAGGPSNAADTSAEAEPSSPTMGDAVAQGAAGSVTTAQPAEATGTLAGPEAAAVATAQSGRTGRDDTAMAAASPGGRSGPRRTMGAPGATGTADAAPELAQVGPSTGGTDAAPEVAVQTDLAGAERMMAGLPGELVDRIVVETALQAGPAATTPGTMAGARRLPRGDQPGPSLAAEVGRGPLRKTDAAGLPRGVAESIEEQPITAAAPTGSDEGIDAAEGTAVGRPSRQEGGLPVQIAAMAGPGGLSHDPSPEVGLPNRRARRESEIIHTVSRRFVIERSGGRLAVDGRIREQPTEAFRQRDPGQRADIVQTYGGSEGTERAVEMGLDYLARHQFPDGHWSLHELPEGVEYDDPGLGMSKSDTAATGLALLSYLGTNYTHREGKYRTVVDRGIGWLVHNQEDNGDLFTKNGGTKAVLFYSHGIATIALCEAYGMTRDPDLREPARKAIDFLIKSQHPAHGGWRYHVDGQGRSTETDTSVTGWQLMALKSAQMAGLDVPEESFARIGDWLDLAEAKTDDGRYVYHPYARDSATRVGNHGGQPSKAMTAEAMLMRMYLGGGRNDAKLIEGADYLKDNLPAIGTSTRSLRDCYYWYYATQAMFQMQGDYWTAWNDRLRPMFESSQEQTGSMAGSWHPNAPVRDAWGHAGGRHYVTAMHLLMLEVYYRHLPLFDELGK